MGNSNGLTAHATKECGVSTKQMARESLFMQMEMYTRENGKMIELMAKVPTSIQTVPTIMVIG